MHHPQRHIIKLVGLLTLVILAAIALIRALAPAEDAPLTPPAPAPASAERSPGPAPDAPADPLAALELDDPRLLPCRQGDARACHELATSIAFDTTRQEGLPQSLVLLHRACELELAVACRDLGIVYEEGVGVDLSPELARDFYQRACDLGEQEACLDAVGVGTTAGFATYAPRWQAQCDEGDPLACLDLAVALLQTAEVRDPQRAHALLERACQLNAPEGCLRLAALQAELGHPQEEVNAQIAAACDQGYGPACTTLAQRFSDANADPATVDTYYARACELDDTDGCAEHALRLARTDQLTEARALWEAGCQRWHGYSCFHHAHSYLNTGSGQLAPPEMVFGYERACTLNVPVACYNLAIYYNTRQPDPDFARGRTYLERACRLDHPQGCVFLAQMRTNGQGGPADRAGAQEARQRACDLGDSAACP
ncbi:tetratricopeptide repeat protein [Lujinxingia litoralis]|uniref:tetratricopeptide repeat protein n=1 Tax=Lujinxingia litoralis TaxID=2211119 RepID=UPI0011B93A56|nr:SEL1-like repeat protein [Lujinxingia litoralis]